MTLLSDLGSALGVKSPDNTVTVKVNGAQISGWDSVEIAAGIEVVPRTFHVGMTALPGIAAACGDVCEVYLGSDKVISGFIDIDANDGDDSQHRLSLTGRGFCADLVDCSAEWPKGQIKGDNSLQLCTKLAQPYSKIKVSAAPGTDLGPAIPQFNLNYGETAYSIIERVTRYAGQLAYEDENGTLILSQAGTEKAGSGFVYGQNVQAFSVKNSMAERFSDYMATMLAINVDGDFGLIGDFYPAYDKDVQRHRLLYLVVEAVAGGQDLCKRRALWEAARRSGRGSEVTVTVDSWRDVNGKLWKPNTLAPVDVPGLRLQDKTLLISNVVFRYGEDGGTLCDITLMPPGAFKIEPVLIQPSQLRAEVPNP